MRRIFLTHAVVTLSFLFLTVALACGQTLERGAVRGTVYDSTHAPIPGAKVTLSNLATALRREMTTAADGGYAFDSVSPGEYTLVAQAADFALTTVRGIVVNVGSSLTIDLTMPLKTAQQSVTLAPGIGACVES